MPAPAQVAGCSQAAAALAAISTVSLVLQSRFVYDELEQHGVFDLVRKLSPSATRMPNIGCNLQSAKQQRPKPTRRWLGRASVLPRALQVGPFVWMFLLRRNSILRASYCSLLSFFCLCRAYQPVGRLFSSFWVWCLALDMRSEVAGRLQAWRTRGGIA